MPERIYGKRELELLEQVLMSGNLGALGGKFTPEFEEKFAKMTGTRYAVAMNSAMSVLHSSVICAVAGAGDEVICDPVFIFGAMAALYNNAIPKFADIDPASYAMDPGKLEEAITERTKAVIVTHPWGFPAQMDHIVEIAHRHSILVIEDCAHAILASYKDRYAGAWGDIGSFSFQASKQMSLGDGGIATTNSEEFAKQLDLNAGAPTFHSIGHGLHYNFRMNELTSAVGIAQLERLPDLIEGLKKNAKYYDEAVRGCKWLRPQIASGAVSTYHYWAATFEGEEFGISLDRFKKAAEEAGFWSLNIGYTQMPAYRHPVIKERLAHAFLCGDHRNKIEYPDGLCPEAERIIPRMVLFYTLQPEEKAREEADKLHGLIRTLEE